MGSNVENRYQIVFDTSPAPLMLVSDTGGILHTNGHLDRLFGYRDGELVGRNVDILVPDEARAHHPELIAAYRDLPTARAMGSRRDLVGLAKDGRRIPIEIGLQPVDADGTAQVMVSILDISDRANSEAKIRGALDAAASAMVMIDSDGRIALANRPTCEMFGYARKELLDQEIEVLVPDAARHRHAVYRRNYLVAPKRRPMGRDRSLTARRKDGTEFPIEIGLTPIDTHDGVFVMSTIIDITERRETERIAASHAKQIETKNAELSRLNEDLTQLIYSASHDLKAPLTSMLGITEFIVADLGAGDTSEAETNAKNVLKLAQRLSRRLESLLALAKVDQQDASVGPVDLSEIIRQAWDDATTDMRNPPRIEVSLEHSGTLRSSGQLIGSILESLLSNACVFRDCEKPVQYVHVRSRDAADGVELSIEDNGIGIPEGSHDDVFKMFKRFSNTDTPGAGLGLAIVKKQVARLHGDIGFHSTPDGTTIVIALPQIREAA